MAAIPIHNVRILREQLAEGEFVSRVREDATVPSSDGSPTVDEYIALEAAAGYLVNFMDDKRIITADVAAVNAAE